jgi:hypothetical protein
LRGAVDNRVTSDESEGVTATAGTEVVRSTAPRRAVGPIIAGYGAFLAVLIPVFAYVGRDSWFRFDDWDYLVTRRAGNLDDLLRPHSGHWEAVPLLVYRGLYSVFGLNYLPFELVAIVASMVSAVLLLVIMLRAGIRPWIAILAATFLVGFGDAQFNVALRVTSITFVGLAVPLGLTQMLLADHSGPRNRRDWIGLGVAMIALLCSNIATVMIFAVALAMLLKRGWRTALFHAGPPAVVFAVWFLTKGRHDTGAGDPARLRPIGSAVHFAWILVTGFFESLTRTHGPGGLFVVVFVVALVVMLRGAGPERRREAAIPCALLAAAALVALETGLGRADLLDLGAAKVRQGHYLYAVAVLAIPALAFVIEESVRYRRRIAPVVMALMVLAVATNAIALRSKERDTRGDFVAFRTSVLLVPRLPVAALVPRSARPFPGDGSPITLGWLLDQLHAGRLPTVKHVTPAARARAILQVSLAAGVTSPTTCRPLTRSLQRRLRHDEALHFRGPGVAVGYVAGTHTVAEAVFRSPTLRPSEWKLVNLGTAMTVTVRRAALVPASRICI